MVKSSYSCTHFTDEETEAQKKLSEVTQPENRSGIISELSHASARFGRDQAEILGECSNCREGAVTLTGASQQLGEEKVAYCGGPFPLS